MLGASLDVGNRGVGALASATASLLQETCPGLELRYLYGNRTGGHRTLRAPEGPITVEVVNCRLAPRGDLSRHVLVILGLAALHRLGLRSPARRNRWMRSLLDARFVGDIRGGDSFSDIYGTRTFLLGSLPLLSAAVLAVPFVMLPQTYGPFRNPLSRVLARYLLRRATVVLTRDPAGVSWVAAFAGREATFCPDVAFTLAGKRPDHLGLVPAGLALPSARPVVAINVSGLLWADANASRRRFGLRASYRDVMQEIVTRLLDRTDAALLFVPHVFGSEGEQEACLALHEWTQRKVAGDRVFRVEGVLDEREVKWLIGQTVFLVGARMHACIAALSQAVPAIGLGYSHKFRGVFATVGMEDLALDLSALEPGDVAERVVRAYQRRDAIAERLAAVMPEVDRAVRRTFREVVGRLLPER